MRHTSRIALVLCLSLPAVGRPICRQDPAASPSSAGQAPASVAPVPKENAPAEQVPIETMPPAHPEALTPTAGEKVPESVPAKKDSAARRTKKRHKRPAAMPSEGPRKIVVREGGANEPTAQIVPGISPAEASRQRQNAEHMLGTIDIQLKPLTGRTLNAQQQETLEQIQNYLGGARSALKEGDVRRASTLAEKAHLLAEDLVKH